MKFKNWSVLFLICFFFGVAVTYAQSPSATPAAGAAAITAVNNAASKVPSSLPAWLIAALSFLLTELAARGVPTAKPQSWFLVIEGVLGAVVAFLQKVQALLVSIGTAFNNVSNPNP
jgi:hypothetical protein